MHTKVTVVGHLWQRCTRSVVSNAIRVSSDDAMIAHGGLQTKPGTVESKYGDQRYSNEGRYEEDGYHVDHLT